MAKKHNLTKGGNMENPLWNIFAKETSAHPPLLIPENCVAKYPKNSKHFIKIHILREKKVYSESIFPRGVRALVSERKSLFKGYSLKLSHTPKFYLEG